MWSVRSIKTGLIHEFPKDQFTEAYLFAKRENGLPLRMIYKPV